MLHKAIFSATQSLSASLPLLPADAVATLPQLQQFSAVRHQRRQLPQVKLAHRQHSCVQTEIEPKRRSSETL